MLPIGNGGGGGRSCCNRGTWGAFEDMCAETGGPTLADDGWPAGAPCAWVKLRLLEPPRTLVRAAELWCAAGGWRGNEELAEEEEEEEGEQFELRGCCCCSWARPIVEWDLGGRAPM